MGAQQSVSDCICGCCFQPPRQKGSELHVGTLNRPQRGYTEHRPPTEVYSERQTQPQALIHNPHGTEVQPEEETPYAALAQGPSASFTLPNFSQAIPPPELERNEDELLYDEFDFGAIVQGMKSRDQKEARSSKAALKAMVRAFWRETLEGYPCAILSSKQDIQSVLLKIDSTVEAYSLVDEAGEEIMNWSAHDIVRIVKKPEMIAAAFPAIPEEFQTKATVLYLTRDRKICWIFEESVEAAKFACAAKLSCRVHGVRAATSEADMSVRFGEFTDGSDSQASPSRGFGMG